MRLVQVMKSQKGAVDKLGRAAAKLIPLDHGYLTADYVAHAEILVQLVETLDCRGVRFM